jgi:hypothetical protein
VPAQVRQTVMSESMFGRDLALFTPEQAQAWMAQQDPVTQARLQASLAATVASHDRKAGLELLGYTTQAHFLMNCGLVALMQAASAAQRNRAEKLILEHEMGELFKVIALGRGFDQPLLGFARGDRSHRL